MVTTNQKNWRFTGLWTNLLPAQVFLIILVNTYIMHQKFLTVQNSLTYYFKQSLSLFFKPLRLTFLVWLMKKHFIDGTLVDFTWDLSKISMSDSHVSNANFDVWVIILNVWKVLIKTFAKPLMKNIFAN